MMKGLFHSMASLSMALFGLSATLTATAQTAEQATTQVVGKEGTVIRFDKSTCHGLFTTQAYGPNIDEQPFGYLRHDISPVLMVSSNAATLKADGSGLYSTIANNFLFEDNSLCLSNSQKVTRIAIAAPKGYRIIHYEFDLQSNTTSGMSFCRVAYDADGNENAKPDSVKFDGAGTSSMHESMSGGNNILYFRMTVNSSATEKLIFKSLKLVYTIDDPYSAQLPNVDGETEVATGMFDLGKFDSSYSPFWTAYGVDYANANGGKGYWGFSEGRVSDKQSAAIWRDGNAIEADVATVEDGQQYYVAAANGEYYVEAPEKFRIVGATLNFLRQDATGRAKSTTKIETEEATSLSVEQEYVISDGNGHYLSSWGNGIVANSKEDEASKWVVKSGTSSNGYVIWDGSYWYLYYGNNKRTNTMTVSKYSSSSSWRYSTDNGLYFTITSGSGWFATTTTYYLTYNEDSGWGVTTSKPTNVVKMYAVSSTTTTTPAASYTAGDFTATAYDRSGENVAEEIALSESASSASVELKDFNNDAVHFRISGLEDGKSALYSVNLRLLPLNPELQNLSVGSKFGDNESLMNTTSFTSVNYNFNDGNPVTIVVPDAVAKDGDDCAVEFLKADNEEKTMWYTDGSKENNTASTGGYSNFFLVSSKADVGMGDDVELKWTDAEDEEYPYPGARTSSVQAGQKGLDLTNIKEVYDGPAPYLVENDFKKSEAEYAAATVTVGGAAKDFYIYTADQPTFQILPEGTGSKHIDFRYFTLKVQCVRQVEEPVVTLVPIYTETLKSANRDGKISSDANTLDTKHTFYGVKVTAMIANDASTTNGVYGYLTSKSIEDAVAAELKKQEVNGVGYYGFGEANMLRGMLYLDISELRGTDEERFDSTYFFKNVADNFLFFVPEGYSSLVGTTNVVEKKSDGTYESCNNVVVRDQQPFFSPYDFKTGRFIVTYERKGTATASGGDNKAKVQNMATVLPFEVNLDGEGHLKLASDVVDNAVTYHNITNSGEVTNHLVGDPNHELTYAVVADPATGLTKADANVPYYITTDKIGFTYTIQDAQFRKTGEVSDAGEVTFEELKRENGTWTAIGTFSGVQPTKHDQRWYFSKEYFWKSGALKANNHFNVRPFRAYFETTDQTDATQAKVVFGDRDIVSTGIGSVVSTASSLQVATGHGFISLTAGSATQVAVYTVAGQLVANASLADGETRRVSLPQGVYMVNHVKVVVK